MNPKEAIEEYHNAVRIACDKYRDYWLAKFNAAGVPFVPSKWRGHFEEVQYAGYELSAVVPAWRNGIRITIWLGTAYAPRSHMWSVKVRSDSGFNKLLRRLQRREFV